MTTVVLKSGTNELKGSAFFFGNTESTQAKSYFASANSVKPETKYQQFGATLGGPILKDKLFFFADYQHTVDNLGQLRRVVIPPMEWRGGDFSTASTIIYDPATGNPDGSGRTPFPGNVIPANRISPIALNILSRLPAPNVPGAGFGQVNYELPSSEREKTTDAFNVKLNYNPGPSDQLSLRFSYQRPEIFVPGTFGELGGAGADFAGTGTQDTYSTALTWTRTLSPSLIMEWRAGYSTYHNVAVSTGTGLDTSTEVGIPGANYDTFSSGLSRIVIQNGFTEPMLGFSASLPWDRGEDTYSVVGTLTILVEAPRTRVSAGLPSVEMTAGRLRDVNLVFAAKTELPDAGLLIELPDGIELVGHPGEQRIQWRTRLAPGNNIVPLTLVAPAPAAGQIIARLRAGEDEKVFRIQVSVNPAEPL